MKEGRLTSQSGLSLIEVLVSIAIVGCLVLALTEAIRNGALGARSVSNMQNVTSEVTELRQYLWNTNTCTGNFQGQKVALKKGLTIKDLKSYDDQMNPSADPVFVMADQPKTSSTVYVESASIIPQRQISDNFYVGVVQMQLAIKGQALGAQSFSRSFPIAITTDSAAQTLTQCGALDILPLNDRICEIASGGTDYYDSTTQSCVSRFETKCFLGDSDSADCPAGWVLAKKKGSANSSCFDMKGGDANAPTITRTYKTIGTVTMYASPFVFKPYEDTTKQGGNCYWATDADTSTWKCGVNCMHQTVF
jgi:prepilin-type N-terminal cleavage/methylation domain-containing protein